MGLLNSVSVSRRLTTQPKSKPKPKGKGFGRARLKLRGHLFTITYYQKDPAPEVRDLFNQI